MLHHEEVFISDKNVKMVRSLLLDSLHHSDCAEEEEIVNYLVFAGGDDHSPATPVPTNPTTCNIKHYAHTHATVVAAGHDNRPSVLK